MEQSLKDWCDPGTMHFCPPPASAITIQPGASDADSSMLLSGARAVAGAAHPSSNSHTHVIDHRTSPPGFVPFLNMHARIKGKKGVAKGDRLMDHAGKIQKGNLNDVSSCAGADRPIAAVHHSVSC